MFAVVGGSMANSIKNRSNNSIKTQKWCKNAYKRWLKTDEALYVLSQ